MNPRTVSEIRGATTEEEFDAIRTRQAREAEAPMGARWRCIGCADRGGCDACQSGLAKAEDHGRISVPINPKHPWGPRGATVDTHIAQERQGTLPTAISEDATHTPSGMNPKDAAALRDGKVPLDLLEHVADVEIARAIHTGATRYGRHNYRTIPIYATTYAAAIRRHLGAWLSGQDLDEDSGISHLAHIGANLHVIFGAMDADCFIDDRQPAARTPDQDERSARSNAQHSSR